jgi:hypothetical protein
MKSKHMSNCFPGNKGARVFSRECGAIVLQALRSAPLTTSQRDDSPRCKFSRQSFLRLRGKAVSSLKFSNLRFIFPACCFVSCFLFILLISVLIYFLNLSCILLFFPFHFPNPSNEFVYCLFSLSVSLKLSASSS